MYIYIYIHIHRLHTYIYIHNEILNFVCNSIGVPNADPQTRLADIGNFVLHMSGCYTLQLLCPLP